MSALGDSLTVGIVLTLIFGAVCFYLYSRMNQNEKRVSLLENLLLSLKISTEASMMGPDLVEPISNPSPLSPGDVDTVSEESYASMLKEIVPEKKVVQAKAKADVSEEEKELLRSVVEQVVDTAEVDADENGPAGATGAGATGSGGSGGSGGSRKMDANYESMSVKELLALARQRGLSGLPSRKRDIVDALKKQGEPAPSAPTPLAPVEGDLEGAAEPGFSVDLEKS
jgi:hypothetical protein